MKKRIIIGVVVLIAIGAGFFLLKGGQTTVPNGEMTENGQAVPLGDNGVPVLEAADKIKAAMLDGTALECRFELITQGTDEMKTVIQSQGEKFRSVSVVVGSTMVSVSDGETMYSWTEGSRTGTKYDFKCIEDLNKSNPSYQEQPGARIYDFETPVEMADSIPGMKCKKIANIDLSVPKGIQFEDACDQLREMMKAAEQMKGELPEGVNIPGM